MGRRTLVEARDKTREHMFLFTQQAADLHLLEHKLKAVPFADYRFGAFHGSPLTVWYVQQAATRSYPRQRCIRPLSEHSHTSAMHRTES